MGNRFNLVLCLVLQRLRFLAISARNLDEFFCKRIGALKRQEAAGVENLINAQSTMAWIPQLQLKYVARYEHYMRWCTLFSSAYRSTTAFRVALT